MNRFPRALLGTALMLLFALLAAWQVPPRLDWDRYRAGIAEMAAARIGRPVRIAGDIHLSLLPQPILIARNVSLADRGDGISATLGALRLQVAFWPLLAGRLVPRDLLLDDPAISVPWPLPRVTPSGVRALPPGFGARLEGGTLQLGGLPLADIDATMRADADTGAFAARGTARLAGYPVRFSALIGAPGADGVATLAVTIDAEEALQGTGGTLRGRLLPDGALAAALAARGPDLSLMLPGPKVAWHLQGAVAAAGGTVHAPGMDVLLGASPGTAGFTLHLAPQPSLEAGIHVSQVALDSWPWRPPAAGSPLKLHLDLSADAAIWHGATLRTPHMAISLAPDQTTIEAASAVLPGNSTFHLTGALRPMPGGASAFSGPITIQSPDARAFLTAAFPNRAPWPSAAARPLSIQADLHAARNDISLANLHATFGATRAEGDAGIAVAARSTLRLALTLDRVAPLEWLAAAPSWQNLTEATADTDLALHLHVAELTLPTLTLHQVALDATADPQRLTVQRLAADIQGGHIELSGTLGDDGTVAAGKLDAAAADAAALPVAWHVVPSLWHGPLHIAATAAGPPHDVTVQIRCDLSDTRAEAEGLLDPAARTLTATATVRHPGAPRLLEALGVPDAGDWLGQGSFALITHIAARPGLFQVNDFSLAAGALRTGGRLQADLSTATPTLSGHLDAPVLTLPPLDPRSDTPLPLAWLTGWQAQLDLSAGSVLVGGRTLAGGLATTLTLAGGTLLASNINAHAAGGDLHADAAVDTTQPAWSARATLTGATLDTGDDPPTLPLTGGTLDITTTLTAAGFSPAAILATVAGTASGTAHGIALQGIDLPRLAHLLTTHAVHLRRTLPTLLATGDTGPVTGDFAASLDHGAVRLQPLSLSGAAGVLAIDGSLDLPARTAALNLAIRPAVADPPEVSLRIAGPWESPRRTLDGVAWTGRK